MIEGARRGITLLAHDGRHGRRHFFGVTPAGRLELRLAAPRHALRVLPAESLVLAPGGRLRGYVRVPLPLVLAWRTGDNGAVPTELVELLPPRLKTTWLEHASGGPGYAYLVHSPFLVDARARAGEAEALVPVVLHNLRAQAVVAAELPLRLRDEDLRELRGCIAAAPRRLLFAAGDVVRERVRSFRGREARA